MAIGKRESNKNYARIDAVDITTDTMCSRGGLSLFARYLQECGALDCLQDKFGALRKSRKGQCVGEIFKQVFCNFLEGGSRHLVHFDRLRPDAGYAASIESQPQQMLSSHAVKRFFKALSGFGNWGFRALLRELWMWRLKQERPPVIVLGVDSMVMDNDEANCREGVAPTYKKVKGFQPLQMTCERYVVDAVLRGGKKHCNHGQVVANMVRRVVKKIRAEYDRETPIVLRLDSGFFDQELFEELESLEIGYTCGGKLYGDIKEWAGELEPSQWGRFHKERQVWEYAEFADRRGTWKKTRRAFYLRPVNQDEQCLLEYARPETVLYTNLGEGGPIDRQLQAAGQERLLTAEGIIECSHNRGCDELVHRALKDFGFEELPFERFGANTAYYYSMLLSFVLYESFKIDVCESVVGKTSYATTLRRRVIDLAAKIVRSGGRVILKLTATAWEQLNFADLWRRCCHPPRFYTA